MAELIEELSRQEKLLGKESTQKLKEKHVMIFGTGGVGSYAAEAIARSGVGKITLVDNDCFVLSNINRQLGALHSTVGMNKALVMSQRLKDINPYAAVDAKPIFFDGNTVDMFDFSQVDFIMDCIDSVPSKVLLIKTAKQKQINIISAMGAGNKLDPTRFIIEDLAKTSYCPLAKVMRSRLKKEGIEHLTVVYSPESPKKCEGAPGSVAFVPSVVGLIMASHVIKELIK